MTPISQSRRDILKGAEALRAVRARCLRLAEGVRGRERLSDIKAVLGRFVTLISGPDHLPVCSPAQPSTEVHSLIVSLA